MAEECVHYFTIQALGRVLILYFWVRSSLNRIGVELILSRFAIKLGIFPFHSWYLNLIPLLNWEIIWVIRVPMKLVILKILFSTRFGLSLVGLGLINVCLAFFILFKEKKIKTFLALTSIFNMGWILLSLLDMRLWVIFILIYRGNLYMLLEGLKKNKVERLFEYATNESKRKFMLIILIGLVIIRIPPTLGFILKMVIILILIDPLMLVRLILLILSLIMTYYYMIIFYYLNLSFTKATRFKILRSSFIVKLVNFNVLRALIGCFFVFYYLNNNLHR